MALRRSARAAALCALTAALVLVPSRAESAPAPTSSPSPGADASREWGTHQIDLPLCRSKAEMDCIEGLRVLTGGMWQVARLLHSESLPMEAPGFVPGSSLSSVWQYQSAAEGTIKVQMLSQIFPKGMTYRGVDYLLHGVEFNLHRTWAADEPSPLEGVTFDCSLGVPGNCLLGARLPERDLFEVVVRTSWIKDNGISIDGLDWSVQQDDMKGGTRWTFRAREALRSQPAKWDDATPAAGWQPVWGVILAHAGEGLEDSAFDPRCAEFGAPRQAGNTPGGGRLHWVKSKGVLDFEIHAPHLDPHGKPLVGTFTAQIPLDWLRCFAGKRLNPAYFSVEVVSEDGEEQAATTSLKVRKGMVTVFATGFHFSSPTIRLTTQKKRR